MESANESTFYSVFHHRLKFWSLNFNAPQLLQKTFVPHGFLFNHVYLHIYYHPSKFVGLVVKHPVCISGVTHLRQLHQTKKCSTSCCKSVILAFTAPKRKVMFVCTDYQFHSTEQEFSVFNSNFTKNFDAL